MRSPIRILSFALFLLSLAAMGCQGSSRPKSPAGEEESGAKEERTEPKAAVPSVSSYSVIPAPVALTPSAGTFAWTGTTAIFAPTDPGAQMVARRLAEAFGGQVRTLSRGPIPKSTSVDLRIDEQFPEEEGYRLSVTDSQIDIVARNPKGLAYAAATLRQLGKRSDPKGAATEFLGVTIEDAPRFSYRGMHLDVARHFFTVEEVKRYLDFLAQYKLNTFHFHLTEDQGWRIEIKKYPRLTEVGGFRKETLIGHYRDQPHRFDGKRYGGFYTQDQIREIVAYASDRFIEVIPEIELPGHSLAALAAYPELGCTKGPFEVQTNWGIFDEVYCPKEETFQFLEDVLTEVIALFPSKYVHIGGDEVTKIAWEKSPVAQAVMKREGLKTEEELQSYFIRRIDRFLTQKGKRLIGWDEILEGGLSKGATVMSWRGMEGGVTAAKQGHDVIMAPAEFTYLNHYQTSDVDNEPPAASHILPLAQVYSFEPVPPELSPKEAAHILGAQGCVWTEYVKTQKHLEYMLFPRLLALSEVLWSPKESRSFTDFSRRLPAELSLLNEEGVNYATHFFEVKAEHKVKDAKLWITLASAGKGTIRYTLDGTPPNEKSPAYQKPFALGKGAQVTAALFSKDEALSSPKSYAFTTHLALGAPGTYANPASSEYPGNGTNPLTDGVFGSSTFNDGKWQGTLAKDFEVTFDLGAAQAVRKVEVGVLRSVSDWILPPKSVSVLTSKDGVTFSPHLSEQPLPVKGPEKPEVVRLTAKVDEKEVRYVRVVAKNGGPLPAWHPGAGKAAWVFLDEVRID